MDHPRPQGISVQECSFDGILTLTDSQSGQKARVLCTEWDCKAGLEDLGRDLGDVWCFRRCSGHFDTELALNHTAEEAVAPEMTEASTERRVRWLRTGCIQTAGNV